MKKLYYLIILTVILGLALTGCSLLSNVGQVPTSEQSGIAYLTKGTEAEPDSFPLYAGQDMLVGEVLVWDNGIDELCVKYQLNDAAILEGWLIYETHWAVADDKSGIPQTKKGNPIPGQFPYGDDELEGVAFYEECISFEDLGVECGEELVIAAHTAIQKLEPVSEECLVSGAGSDNVLYLAEDSLNPGYPLDYTAAYQSYAGSTVPSVACWEAGVWPQITGADWISNTEYDANLFPPYDSDNDTWRLFTRSFTLPDNAVNILGSLTMNCDNAEEAYLNDQFVGDGSPAIVYGDGILNIYPPSGLQHGWSTVEGPWDVSSLLRAGSNKLWTMTRNYGWSGGPEANPTGLIYKLCYEYDLVTEESAWAANKEIEPEDEEGTIQFDGANWATYFEYTTCCWEEELIIPAYGATATEPIKVTSTHSLIAGHTYQFVASGTCNWRVPPSSSGYLADAEYWLRHDQYGEGWTKMDPGSIAIWDGSAADNIDWGVYNDSHIYTIEYIPSADGPMTFYFYDDYYGDNSDSLTLKIYSCF